MRLYSGLIFLIFFHGWSLLLPDPPFVEGNVLSDSDKKELLELVNAARSRGCKCGDQTMPPAAPVVWDLQLESAAQEHCRDMAAHNSMTHEGSDGSTPDTRMTRAGFAWNSCAENIANGYDTPQLVIEGWLKSPGHCKNLMNPSYRFMGVARTGAFWTQNFAGKPEKR